MAGHRSVETILLRADSPRRLFNSFDPSPFRERDLDPRVETYILDWAREARRDDLIAITIQLPATLEQKGVEAMIREGVRYNFTERTARAGRDMRELFREGWRALMVGVPVLAISLIVSQFLAASAIQASPARIASESFLILGWVANWRPLEIFLYGWWPILRRRSLYRRLADAHVTVEWD